MLHDMRTLLPTSDVARQAGISPTTVTREVARGRLKPAMRAPGPAGAMLFDPRDVDRWLRNRRAA